MWKVQSCHVYIIGHKCFTQSKYFRSALVQKLSWVMLKYKMMLIFLLDSFITLSLSWWMDPGSMWLWPFMSLMIWSFLQILTEQRTSSLEEDYLRNYSVCAHKSTIKAQFSLKIPQLHCGMQNFSLHTHPWVHHS